MCTARPVVCIEVWANNIIADTRGIRHYRLHRSGSISDPGRHFPHVFRVPFIMVLLGGCMQGVSRHIEAALHILCLA